MSDLSPCPRCQRHVREATCPFCGSTIERRERIALGLGRMSRAMVFASATLTASAGCAHKQQPKNAENMQEEQEERHHGGGGCVDPDPKRIEDLEKQKAEVDKQPDSPEKAQEERNLDEELLQARQPQCMPYGAPPARRRIV